MALVHMPSGGINRLGYQNDGRRSFSGGSGGSGALLNFANTTFLRASEASFVDPREGWAFVAQDSAAWKSANIPRIFADGSILIEGPRTNIVHFSEAVADALLGVGTWGAASGAHTITRNAVVAPDGGTGGDRFQIPTFSRSQFTQTAVGTSVGSAYLRAYLGSSTHNFGFSETGGASAAVALPLIIDDSAWQRLTVNSDSTYCIPVDGRNLSTGGGSVAGDRDVVLWGVQVEDAVRFPSSYIRTAGASATRALDSCTVAAADVPPSLRTDNQEWVTWPSFSSAGNLGGSGVTAHYIFTYSGGASIQVGLRFRLEIAGTGGVQVINHASGATAQVLGLSWSRHQRLSITYNPTTGALTLSGFTSGDGTYAALGTIDTFEGDLRIGRVGGSSSPFFGVIAPPRIVA